MHAGMMQPWKPGQSGNPGGKLKAEIRILDLARSKSEDALKELIRLMEHSEDERIRYLCAVHILDRAFGKPKERTDKSDDKPVFTHEEKIEMLQEIARRHGYNLEPAKDGA